MNTIAAIKANEDTAANASTPCLNATEFVDMDRVDIEFVDMAFKVAIMVKLRQMASKPFIRDTSVEL